MDLSDLTGGLTPEQLLDLVRSLALLRRAHTAGLRPVILIAADATGKTLCMPFADWVTPEVMLQAFREILDKGLSDAKPEDCTCPRCSRRRQAARN